MAVEVIIFLVMVIIKTTSETEEASDEPSEFTDGDSRGFQRPVEENEKKDGNRQVDTETKLQRGTDPGTDGTTCGFSSRPLHRVAGEQMDETKHAQDDDHCTDAHPPPGFRLGV